MDIISDVQHVKVFPELDDALVWVEDRILGIDRQAVESEETLLDLNEMELFKQRKKETLADLEAQMKQVRYKVGEKIYSPGDKGDKLFLIRRGAVRIVLPVEGGAGHHLATYGRGNFFGGLSFLDGQPRSNEAVACTDTDVYVFRTGCNAGSFRKPIRTKRLSRPLIGFNLQTCHSCGDMEIVVDRHGCNPHGADCEETP